MKDISYLKESGIDIDGALQLLGTVEMYNDTLNEFLKGIDEKFNNIKTYKDNNDLVNYSILVHSLKSDSKYLGFTKLAMLAYNHEIKHYHNLPYTHYQIQFLLNSNPYKIQVLLLIPYQIMY